MRSVFQTKRFAWLRKRAAFAVRLFFASVGGYLLAVAAVFAFARGLPLSRAEAMTTASLLSILVMPAAAIWAFAAAHARTVLWSVAGLTGLLALVAWLLGQPA